VETALRDQTNDPRGLTWVLNLAAWKSATSTGRSGLVVNGLGVDVELGSGGAAEKFSLDYPFNGYALAVQAQQLTVTIRGTGVAGANTVLGAWITVDSSGRNSFPMNATLTEATQALGPLGTTVFLIPARARAFRLYPTNGIFQFTTDQLDAFSVGVGRDSGGPPPNQTDPSSRAAWFPLHPRATSLTISDATGIALSFVLQWQLDTTG